MIGLIVKKDLYDKFFKTALKFVTEERNAEKQTRQELLDALIAGNIATGDDAIAIVDRAVVAWRASNRGAELPRRATDPVLKLQKNGQKNTAITKEWKSLLNQMFLIAGDAQSRVTDIKNHFEALGYKPLRLIAAGTSKLICYVEPKVDERDDRLVQHNWVHKITIEHKKTGGYSEKYRTWAILPKVAASETVIHEWKHADWTNLPSVFVSFNEKQKVFENISSFDENLNKLYNLDVESMFEDWKILRHEMSKNKKVNTPNYIIPFGLVLEQKYAVTKLNYLCLYTEYVHAMLYLLANKTLKPIIEKSYVNYYNNKTVAAKRFTDDVAKFEFQIGYQNISKLTDIGLVTDFAHIVHDTWTISDWDSNKKERVPTLDELLEKHIKKSTYWIPEKFLTNKYFEELNKSWRNRCSI